MHITRDGTRALVFYITEIVKELSKAIGSISIPSQIALNDIGFEYICENKNLILEVYYTATKNI